MITKKQRLAEPRPVWRVDLPSSERPRFSTVTLGVEDVEWVTPNSELKDAVWDDRRFATWVNGRDLWVALEAVSLLHREIGNQLTRSGETWQSSAWARRALALVRPLKKRRQELRRMVRHQFGDDIANRAIASFDSRHPKAVRGA